MKKQPEINPVWDKEIEKALQAIRENKWKITQNRLEVLKRLSK
jgi:Fe2+ or Zn2+ uptake regulation protein